jgi:hypothetical protein
LAAGHYFIVYGWYKIVTCRGSHLSSFFPHHFHFRRLGNFFLRPDFFFSGRNGNGTFRSSQISRFPVDRPKLNNGLLFYTETKSQVSYTYQTDGNILVSQSKPRSLSRFSKFTKETKSRFGFGSEIRAGLRQNKFMTAMCSACETAIPQRGKVSVWV